MMSRERKVHPLLTALVPMMPPDQLEALIDQVRRTKRMPGPITVWRGQLVDGRARVKCADKLRMGLEEIDISDMQECTLVDIILERNLYRRHLTAGQRALIAIEASKRAAVMNLKHITRERAAACSGISPSSLHSLQYAIKIVPELIEPIRAGTISINRANEACQAMIDWPAAARADLIRRVMALDSGEAARLIRSLRSRPPAANQAGKNVVLRSAVVSVDADDTAAASGEKAGAVADAPKTLAAVADKRTQKVSVPDKAAGGGSLHAGYAPLLAVLDTVTRLHDALRELQALLVRHPPATGAATDIVAAIRTALDTDWTVIQRELVQAERALEEHSARHG